ncbi:MAG: basic amino acid ABC transporter substrate-binding protein [Clostridiales bacterium]|nr:basic amino acid ABC transporter substrate-binding protein [Clostridiales bacterium]
MFSKILALGLALSLGFALASCAVAQPEEEIEANKATSVEAEKDGGDTGNTKTDDSKVLVMATNAYFPPYEYYEGSEITGIDAEIAKAIAGKLGMELQIEDVEFDSIIAGVQSGKFDMGMAGMTVTEERQMSVNFSDPYATGIQVIIVKEDSAITDIDSLYDGDYLIGVQQGTTGDIYISEDIGDDAVIRYSKGNDAVLALVSGKVDAVVIDNEPAKAYVDANPGLKILETPYTVEDYAICFAKDNEELRDQVNGALKELTEDGTIAAIIEKYIPSNG